MWSVIKSIIPEWSVLMQALFLMLVPLVLMKLSNWAKSLWNQPNKTKDTDSKTDEENVLLTGQFDKDLKAFKDKYGQNSDVQVREFTIRDTNTRAAILYTDGLTDGNLINSHLLTPLMEGIRGEVAQQFEQWDSTKKEDFIRKQVLSVGEAVQVKDIQELGRAVLFGKSALIVEGVETAIATISVVGKIRDIQEPLSETLLRGPRLGFTERLSDNTGLLRLQGSNESLHFKSYRVGARVKKDLLVAYIEDIVDPMLLEEIDRRIKNITIDDPLESGYIEQLIEDNMLSPFQQAQNTERPDRVMSALLEGRAAILLDGTPFALIVPVSFSMLLQSPEDYYERWISGSFIRSLRIFAAMLSLFAPALYISFISFHPGLIPTKLALSIAESRQGVPFPSIIEALIMEVAIEILREAGIRLPRPIGPAMGIVGGLIIGDAAVQAGIVSPFLVIVVAVTAISSFTIPVYSAGIAIRILRFVGMLSAAVFGLYGVVLFFLFVSSHLVRLKSFGFPYVRPAVPYRLNDWKDIIIRVPLKFMKMRPSFTKIKDKDRQ